MWWLAAVLALGMLLTGCGQGDKKSQTEHEKEIYHLVLAEVYPEETVFTIEETTRQVCLGISPFDSEYLPGLKDETIEAYNLRNSEHHSLEEILPSSDVIHYVNSFDYWNPDKGHDIPPGSLDLGKLQEEFPGVSGVLHLSAIGFSDNQKQALVCAEIRDGTPTGVQYAILLGQKRDGWKIEEISEIHWIT